MDNSKFNKDTTSKKESIPNISQKRNKDNSIQGIRRYKVLEYIRKNSPITKYKLAKDLGIAYTTIYQMIKEFEFVGLVKIKVVVGNNNRTHALIYVEEDNGFAQVEEEK